jgi:dipeptide/tripeptide permease
MSPASAACSLTACSTWKNLPWARLAICVQGAPVVGISWYALGRRGLEPQAPMKFVIGIALLALGFLMLAFGIGIYALSVAAVLLVLTPLLKKLMHLDKEIEPEHYPGGVVEPE